MEFQMQFPLWFFLFRHVLSCDPAWSSDMSQQDALYAHRACIIGICFGAPCGVDISYDCRCSGFYRTSNNINIP